MDETGNRRRRRAVGGGIAAAVVTALIAVPAIGAGDRNDDGIPDRWERKHDLSLKVDQAKRDQDRDALKNKAEWKSHMDPRDDDTDGDGIEDGDEGAGTIKSFDPATGELVINVFADRDVSGLVTDETEIECENDDADEGPGDDDGPNHDSDDDNSGDDDSGHGSDDDAGDDDRSGSNSGSDRSDDSESSDDANCGVEALVPGAVVREAELKLSGGEAIFKEVELR